MVLTGNVYSFVFMPMLRSSENLQQLEQNKTIKDINFNANKTVSTPKGTLMMISACLFVMYTQRWF